MIFILVSWRRQFHDKGYIAAWILIVLAVVVGREIYLAVKRKAKK